jgi:hypothetical protein
MMNLKSKISQIILFFTTVRIIIASTLGLGNDEVYYITYAKHLQWNYFDHPPIIALLIKFTTLNLWLDSDLFIRLGAIIFSGINTYLIYLIAKKIKDEKAGIVAAILFSSSFYCSIIAGTFIMPDAPQLFFWMLSIYLLVQIALESANKNTALLLFGLTAGLCTMSKIHGIFLWFGFGLYVLFFDRKLLKNGYLYVSVLITIACISPILIWNIDNDFITYSFHSKRVTLNRGLNFTAFVREFVGGIAYNNPINYFVIVMSLWFGFKQRMMAKSKVYYLMLLLGLPLILILLGVSLFRDTLPHWSGPGYTSLIILSACMISQFDFRFENAVNYAKYLIITIVCIGIPLIHFYPGTLGNQKTEKLGKGDFTLDMYDWDFFRAAFKAEIISKYPKTTFVINNKWFPAAHIDHYIATPLGLHFVAIGKLEDIHTYYWLNNYREKIKKGDDAYFVTFSNSYKNPNDIYSNTFAKINLPDTITQYRANKPVRNMLIYLLEDYQVLD